MSIDTVKHPSHYVQAETGEHGMKLSEKGVSKIWALIHKDTLKSALFSNAIEFESNDFEDCVVLTLEEAKEIAWLIHALKDSLQLYTGPFDYDEYCTEAFDLLVSKYEQAEGKE